MSIETWKAKFYPIPASEVPAKDALQHSLKKWQGLTDENLKKHGLRKPTSFSICEEQERHAGLTIDSSTCALCFHHMDGPPDYEGDDGDCRGCPLYDLRGMSCFAGEAAPYAIYVGPLRDPQPMIRLIELAINKLKGKKRAKAKS